MRNDLKSGLRLAAFLILLSTRLCHSQRHIVVSSTIVTQAKDVDGVDYDIFPETQNVGNSPAVWRFDVEPMFVPRPPAKDAPNGSTIDIQQTEFSAVTLNIVGGKRNDVHTRVIIPLVLRSQALTDKAIEALNTFYKDKGYTFSESNISTLPVTQIALTFGKGELDPCTLLTPTIQLSGSEPFVQIQFDCLDHPSKLTNYTPADLKSVQVFIKHLPVMIASLDITYNAKEAEPGSVNVDSQDVRGSNFYAKLSGKGDKVFVSRDDLRTLGIEASHELALRFQGRRLTADEMQSCIVPLMANFPETSIDLSKVDAETLQATYNSKDLDPKEIDKEMSDTIDKSSSKDEVKFSGSFGGKALFGLAEANGSMSGSDFQERMAEHGVKTEWDGKEWVAKALDVKQVNMTELSQSISRGCYFTTYGSETPLTHRVRPIYFK
jgi:hypothetical protein